MAFCNSCGSTLTDGSQFCSKCGKPVGTPAPVPVAAPPAGSSALKIVLIVVAVIVALGILGIVTVSVVAYKVAKNAHVTQEGDHVKVETPFGSVETSKDADEAARNLGVEIYPGAEVRQEGAAIATVGAIRTVTASFSSNDSADKVCAFYKSKFPNANVNSSDQNRCTIVNKDQKTVTTINVEGGGDSSTFQIASVTK
jgi:hypothetical protein